MALKLTSVHRQMRLCIIHMQNIILSDAEVTFLRHFQWSKCNERVHLIIRCNSLQSFSPNTCVPDWIPHWKLPFQPVYESRKAETSMFITVNAFFVRVFEYSLSPRGERINFLSTCRPPFTVIFTSIGCSVVGQQANSLIRVHFRFH